MPAIEIILPDQSVKTFNHEPTILEVAQSLGPRLAQETVGAQLNEQKEIVDIRTPLKDKTRLKIITLRQEEANEVLRHSAAHIMAQAVQSLWPDVQVTIGPVIENGFYYDFYHPKYHFIPEDLEKIEKKMAEIVKADYEVVKEVWSKDKAISTFQKMKENFKVEIIEDIAENKVSIYRQGDWLDLCRGPHVQRTGQIKAFRLLSLAGAYWRGDEKRESLQRIYGTAFRDKAGLREHLYNLEEAKKRDHRKLGKDLNLFFFNSLSPGSPFFTAKGTVIYNELQSFIREKYKQYDYEEVITPQIFDESLYLQSGHYENYKENMYFTEKDDRNLSFKPMNCPGHCLIFRSQGRSYRDLPWRVADFGRLHRCEKSGVIHGLTRVRSFVQDDAHIFCTLDHLQQEICSFMDMLKDVYKVLGLSDFKVYLSTRPEKRMGSEENWNRSEEALEKGLKSLGLDYHINAGDGAFYGPKLDIMFMDSLKRPWQLGTLQCDFNMPEAFELQYVGEDNKPHKPVMLHRAILGSLERFLGVYLEHTAGHLPLWLSPYHVTVMNISERQRDYSRRVADFFKEAGLRVHLDLANEKLGFKIREAQIAKMPYMVILGDEELKKETLSVRLRTGENKAELNAKEFLGKLQTEVKERHLNSIFSNK